MTDGDTNRLPSGHSGDLINLLVFLVLFSAWVEEEKMAVYDGNREKLKPAKISANLQAAIDKIEEALVEWVSRRR